MRKAELTIEGVTFKVAPTPLAKLAEITEGLANGFDTKSPEGVRALTQAVFHGARRAKSDITLEWLEENVDMFNMHDVLRVFCEVNGFEIKKEQPASGEAAAAGPTS